MHVVQRTTFGALQGLPGSLIPRNAASGSVPCRLTPSTWQNPATPPNRNRGSSRSCASRSRPHASPGVACSRAATRCRSMNRRCAGTCRTQPPSASFRSSSSAQNRTEKRRIQARRTSSRLRNHCAATSSSSAETTKIGRPPHLSMMGAATATPTDWLTNSVNANSDMARPRASGAICVALVCSVLWNM